MKEVQLLERGGGIRFKLRKENGKVEIFGVGEGWQNQIWTWEKKMTKLKFLGVGGVGGWLVESDLDLGKKKTKLKFLGVGGVGGGLVESDLDFGRKMTKLKFWVEGVGRIRFGLWKKNDKVEIFGVGGVGGDW